MDTITNTTDDLLGSPTLPNTSIAPPRASLNSSGAYYSPNSKTNQGSDTDHDLSNGDFARLVPSNYAARLAFSQVVDQLYHQQNSTGESANRAALHFKYMCVSATKECEPSGTESSFSSNSQQGDGKLEEMWTGHYRLNLDILPAQYKLGWILGRGREDLPPTMGVEFRLATSSKSKVSGRHARLIHNDAGILLIASDSRTITIDGKNEFHHEQRALLSPVTSLGFGNLTYRLVFTGLPRYAQQLVAIRKRFGTLAEPPAFLDPTPSDTNYVLNKYLIKGVFASGSTCVVQSGYHQNTGQPVAIKKMKRDAANRRAINQELKFLRMLDHPGICKIFEDFVVTAKAGLQRVDEVYFIYPLAEKRLLDLIPSDMSTAKRVSIFRQMLLALDYLQSQGIMHRDIKPQNITLLASNPIHAQLIDFGSATDELESTDHMAGTLRYLAPEVVILKHTASARQVPYTCAVDIWGLGLAMYELFAMKHGIIGWTQIDRESYVALHRTLTQWIILSSQDALRPLVAEVISEMLTWSPSDRKTGDQYIEILDNIDKNIKV